MWVNDGRPCLTSVPLSLPRIWVIASTLTAPHLPLGRSPLERVGKGRGMLLLLSLLRTLSLSPSSFIPLPTPPLLSLPLSISSFSARSSLTFNRSSVISGCYFFVQRFLARTIYPRDTTATGNTILDILRFPCYRRERIKPLG